MSVSATVDGTNLSIDRLDSGAVVDVQLFEGVSISADDVREPHRHDYHELIFVAEGRGEQLIDGCRVPVEAPTLSVIGRGQIHQFFHAESLRGGLLRFTDAVLHGGSERIASGWLLAGRGGRTIRVPEAACSIVTPLFRALAEEIERTPDPYGADVVRHLISTILLWTERWYDAQRSERQDADDPDAQLLRRFTEQLERDFAAHHDARHYADALAMPGPALARSLTAITGRSTKELVTERVMVEAARLLRYTDLTVGEIAYRVGYEDPLYFSRAFKRYGGRSPQAYRASVRGD
jgi:AraC family transcriptional regulator, transcriptional activator of pobA